MSVATLGLNVGVEGADGPVQMVGPKTWRFGQAAALENGKREVVSLTAGAFQALSPPTGAKAVAILLPATAESLTLKGVTGDTGIVLSPATNPLGLPVVLPLGAAPSLGLYNGGAGSEDVQVVWI